MIRAGAAAVVLAALAITGCSAHTTTTKGSSSTAEARAEAVTACGHASALTNPGTAFNANEVSAIGFAADSAAEAMALDSTWVPFYAALKDLAAHLTARANGGSPPSDATDLATIRATCEQLGAPL